MKKQILKFGDVSTGVNMNYQRKHFRLLARMCISVGASKTNNSLILFGVMHNFLRMKMSSVIVYVLLLAGCGQQAGKNQVTSADLPEGASVKEFEDMPGLLLVQVKDAQGNTFMSGRLFNGRREGAWIEYDFNGKVDRVTSYVDGLKEGTMIEFDDHSQISVRCDYHAGERDGAYVAYTMSRKAEEREYVEGKLEGTVRKYYDTGKLMEESNYHNGTMDGISRWYDQEGNVSIEYEYDNGKLVRK